MSHFFGDAISTGIIGYLQQCHLSFGYTCHATSDPRQLSLVLLATISSTLLPLKQGMLCAFLYAGPCLWLYWELSATDAQFQASIATHRKKNVLMTPAFVDFSAMFNRFQWFFKTIVSDFRRRTYRASISVFVNSKGVT